MAKTAGPSRLARTLFKVVPDRHCVCWRASAAPHWPTGFDNRKRPSGESHFGRWWHGPTSNISSSHHVCCGGKIRKPSDNDPGGILGRTRTHTRHHYCTHPRLTSSCKLSVPNFRFRFSTTPSNIEASLRSPLLSVAVSLRVLPSDLTGPHLSGGLVLPPPCPLPHRSQPSGRAS